MRILSNMTPLVVQTTGGTFSIMQTPPTLVNQTVSKQTIASHAPSFMATTPFSMPIQQHPPPKTSTEQGTPLWNELDPFIPKVPPSIP